jgi:Family of unknown function (DUF6200)
MATTASSAPASSEPHGDKETGKPQIIVDLGEPQPAAQIRRLRRGKGKLFHQVERIVDDLARAGTVKSNAQAVVIIVRELPGIWPFDDLADED